MKQSIHPGASVWKDTQQYREGSNPLAIHFENKAEPKPVRSVTKAFRATKNCHLTNWLENHSPFPSYGIDEHPVVMNKNRLTLGRSMEGLFQKHPE